MTHEDQKYLGYRFPIEIISHAVWLSHRFMLSLRDVSELLLSRGIEVSHESIRERGLKFGHEFAKSKCEDLNLPTKCSDFYRFMAKYGIYFLVGVTKTQHLFVEKYYKRV